MHDIELLGVPGSPYTRKMLALLRYRRIPHRMIWGSHFDPPENHPTPKVKLLPTFYFPTPDGREAMVDSTPIIHRLEKLHTDRSVTPSDPILGFLNQLIEDFADEWLTKAMFHYRWHHAHDAAHAAPLLIYSQHPQLSAAQAKEMSDAFARRQISRLPVVGSNDATAEIIESSYQRLVGIMDGLIERQGFILGPRPCAADFAVYGQLTQLGVFDPTPSRYLEERSPRLRAWLDRVEDLSGVTPQHWLEPTAIHEHLRDLLREIGHVYVPYLLANAQAVARGESQFEWTIDAKRWSQAVFPYQVKCLAALRQARANLSAPHRQTLDVVLAGTGCEALF